MLIGQYSDILYIYVYVYVYVYVVYVVYVYVVNHKMWLIV